MPGKFQHILISGTITKCVFFPTTGFTQSEIHKLSDSDCPLGKGKNWPDTDTQKILETQSFYWFYRRLNKLYAFRALLYEC